MTSHLKTIWYNWYHLKIWILPATLGISTWCKQLEAIFSIISGEHERMELIKIIQPLKLPSMIEVWLKSKFWWGSRDNCYTLWSLLMMSNLWGSADLRWLGRDVRPVCKTYRLELQPCWQQFIGLRIAFLILSQKFAALGLWIVLVILHSKYLTV